ncbi:MAG: CbtB-domain containing protein [Methylococcales bacterium]|nr:CbtB-domain containing protein [Methylococcales bacterium]
MSIVTQTTTTPVTSFQKNRQILASVLLGLIVLSIVGFAPLDVIHNAAHDTRHSSGFPCH